jgi:hypothetical protein
MTSDLPASSLTELSRQLAGGETTSATVAACLARIDALDGSCTLRRHLPRRRCNGARQPERKAASLRSAQLPIASCCTSRDARRQRDRRAGLAHFGSHRHCSGMAGRGGNSARQDAHCNRWRVGRNQPMGALRNQDLSMHRVAGGQRVRRRRPRVRAAAIGPTPAVDSHSRCTVPDRPKATWPQQPVWRGTLSHATDRTPTPSRTLRCSPRQCRD